MQQTMRTKTERVIHSAAASATGGALWIAGGLLEGTTQRWQPAADMLVAAALPLLLAALLGLASQLRSRLGRSFYWVRGLACVGAAIAGSARLAAATLGMLPGVPWFGVGVLMFGGALILLGSGALRTATQPGWEGLLLLVGLIGLFLPVGAGIAGTAGLTAWATWGVGWVWIGNVLWQTRVTAGPLRAWRETVERSRR